MPSPFLEGCPKILITRVLVSKTETGTEFYNYLTLFLKCSINLLSFIVKKKKKIQVQCMILDAWGWCTGTTPRDGTGREEGGGSGWGTHVYLWQIHVDV